MCDLVQVQNYPLLNQVTEVGRSLQVLVFLQLLVIGGALCCQFVCRSTKRRTRSEGSGQDDPSLSLTSCLARFSACLPAVNGS